MDLPHNRIGEIKMDFLPKLAICLLIFLVLWWLFIFALKVYDTYFKKEKKN